jgi:hypothetical protein
MLVKSAYHIDLAPSSRPYFAPVVGGIAASVSEMPFSQIVQFRPKVYLAGCRRAGWDLSAFAQGTIVSLYSSESPALPGPPTPPSTIASVPTSVAVASGQTGADFISPNEADSMARNNAVRHDYRGDDRLFPLLRSIDGQALIDRPQLDMQ